MNTKENAICALYLILLHLILGVFRSEFGQRSTRSEFRSQKQLVSSIVPNLNNEYAFAKGGFFSESVIRFSNLQISKKKYSKKLS